MEQIRNVTGNSLSVAFDTNADEASQLLTVRTFGPEGGRLIVLLTPSEAAAKERPDVKIERKLHRIPLLFFIGTQPSQEPSFIPLSV